MLYGLYVSMYHSLYGISYLPVTIISPLTLLCLLIYAMSSTGTIVFTFGWTIFAFNLFTAYLGMSNSYYSASFQGFLQKEDNHNMVEEDDSEFKKSVSGITDEEREASKANHEHGISATTAISRHALCILTLRCMLTVYNFLHTSQKAITY